MSNQRRTRFPRPAATPLAALCGALFVIFALVAPVFAVEGPTKLYDPSVSPRAGSPTTTITFEVGYRNREGSAPDHVSVVIDGVAHAMSGDGSTNWKAGLRNHYSTTLRAGTHTVSFEAMSRDKFSDTVDGGTVEITIPPTPTPTPTPTPRPTAKPTPVPTSAPTAAGGSTGAGSTDGSTGGTAGTDGTSTGSGTVAPDGTGTSGSGDVIGSDGVTAPTDGTDADGPAFPGYRGYPGPVGGTGPVAGGSTSGQPDGSARASDAAGATGFGAAGWTGGPGDGPDSTSGGPAGADPNGNHDVVTGGAGWGALASALETLGIQRPPTITMLPMLVGTTGAMTMAFAFAIFGKKRRDEEPPAPDEVLRANAARGHGGVPGSEVASGVVRVAAVPGLVDAEAGMPRWRRPSLLEARKADPSRSVASSHRMSFDSGAVAASEGRERRVIRYAVVRLLDAPDELRSAEIGQLDQGDEVQLIERSGSYWLVLCPDGRQGWLHRMTLGEIVSDAPSGSFSRDIDDDVLTAFLTARARA